MLKRFTLALTFLLTGLILTAQTFLNGDFENTSAVGDQINLSNSAFDAEMPYDTSFGTEANLDIITSSTWGPPEHGNWYCALTGGGTDKLSLKLSAPLVAGNSYTISFYYRKYISFATYPVVIGLSTNATSLGATLDTLPPAIDGIWTQNIVSFIAPNNGQYITVVMVCCGVSSQWVNVDNFSFTCGLNLGPDTTVCSGSSYQLNATTTGATAYLWQDGSTNPTFNVTTAGLYWAQVTSPGCTVRDSVNVAFSSSPVINLGNDTGLCTGQTLLLNATTAGATYYWQDGSVNATYTVTTAGTYAVSVTAGSCTSTDSIQVNYTSPPTVSLGADTTICSGRTLVLNAGNSGDVYQWQDNSTNETFSVSSPGTYWVKVTNNGCSAADTIIINFNNAISINLGNDTTICAHDSIILNAFQTGASYLWQDNTTSPTYPVTQTGTYAVTVTVAGCTGSDSVSVVVRPAIAVAINSNHDTICATDSAQICATPGFASYSWNDGDTSACIQTNLAGNYYVMITDTNGCRASSNRVALNVFPDPSVSISISGDTLSGHNAVSYQWYLDGNAIPLATSDIYVVTAAGNYTLGITDTNGCTAVSSVVNITSIKNLSADGLKIYATAHGWHITVSEEFIGAYFRVFDDNGRVVFKSKFASPETELNLDVAGAIYFLQVNSANGALVKKLPLF